MCFDADLFFSGDSNDDARSACSAFDDQRSFSNFLDPIE